MQWIDNEVGVFENLYKLAYPTAQIIPLCFDDTRTVQEAIVVISKQPMHYLTLLRNFVLRGGSCDDAMEMSEDEIKNYLNSTRE